ncbi:MAG: hypothetical protein AB6733_01865 [Clostridiaceae bacterium]
MIANFSEVFNIASKDRFLYLRNRKTRSFVKDYSFDIVIKFLIVLFNSIGGKKEIKYLYVDEIKNSSMSTNLYATKKNSNKEDSYILSFYKYKFEESHAKVGYITGVILIIFYLLQLLISLVFVFFGDKVFTTIQLKIIQINYYIYFNLLPMGRDSKIILVTDHHYYSALTALFNKKSISVVLQHGAICDISYFTPVHADYFFAWGNNSKAKLNDEKAISAGTYKFDSLINANILHKSDFNEEIKLLWPLRPIDEKYLKYNFNLFVSLANTIKDKKFKLLVKKHPSSFSNFDFIEENSTANLSVECISGDLKEIDFDIAVIDNSTIGFDLMVINKPFVYIDNLIENEIEIGYQNYGIPTIKNEKDIITIFKEIFEDSEKYYDDFNKIKDKFLKEELENLHCKIDEVLLKLRNNKSN